VREYDQLSVGRPAWKTGEAIIRKLRQTRAVYVDDVHVRKQITVRIECSEAESDALAIRRDIGQQAFKIVRWQIGDLSHIRAIWINSEKLETPAQVIAALEHNRPALFSDAGPGCSEGKKRC
jgi:hypothetical protein